MKDNMLLFFVLVVLTISCSNNDGKIISKSKEFELVLKTDSSRILSSAVNYLNREPVPITNYYCDRSLGSVNDFYSEGDYWWPNPEDKDGPYIKRDGMSNPNFFKHHREAMRNMSIEVATLTAAYKITSNKKFADHAIKHLKVWFINSETRMNPNMNFAQAIKGICPGRGVGLIDAIHLVEPARSISVLHELKGLDEQSFKTLQNWFSDFLEWMTTHEYGIDERERKNNHGTCWVMQAAEYARLTGNKKIMEYCRNRYKKDLLPSQMAENGSFPMELSRTKPYGYSLFNIDIMSAVCRILSTENENLFTFKLEDGRSLEQGLKYIYPYIEDKSKWNLKPDVMYWDEWPVRHPALLFGGLALNNVDFINLWKRLDPLPKSEEGLRNFPIREPILWLK